MCSDRTFRALMPPSLSACNSCCSTIPVSEVQTDRKSTRLNSSHLGISYAVFCLKKKKTETDDTDSKRINGTAQRHTMKNGKHDHDMDLHKTQWTHVPRRHH